MTTQLALALDGAPPRPRRRKLPAHAPGSETSRQAAVAIAPKISALHLRILSWVANRAGYGATRKEVCAGLGVLTQTMCARLNELEQRKLLFRPDHFVLDEKRGGYAVEPLTRENCGVYMLTIKGRTFLHENAQAVLVATTGRAL